MTNPENVPDAIRSMRGPPMGYFVVVPPVPDSDELDIAQLLAIATASWKILLGAALISGAIAAVITLQMRNTYRAMALVAPVTQQKAGGGGLGDQVAGLVGLAGIDIAGQNAKKEELIATLSSPGFAREFIVANNLMPVLFDDRWDPVAQQWRPGKKPPTLETAVERFVGEVRMITEDKKTGLVKVTIETHSPQLAADWANAMVETANQRVRAEAIEDAERSVKYLHEELAKTTVVQLQEAIYRLMEEQVDKAMFANVRRDYAFRVIDPAVPPERKARPKRAVVVAIAAIVGMAIGLVGVFARRAYRKAQAAR